MHEFSPVHFATAEQRLKKQAESTAETNADRRKAYPKDSLTGRRKNPKKTERGRYPQARGTR